MNHTCDRAPAGWWCSRERGHDGPCAARPLSERDQIEAMLAELFTPEALGRMRDRLGAMEQSCMGILYFRPPTLRDLVRLLNRKVNPEDYPESSASYVETQRLDAVIEEFLKHVVK